MTKDLSPKASKQSREPTPDSSERPSKAARTNGGDLSDDSEEQVLIQKDMNPVNRRIQRYLVAIEYIGTRFCGAQQQATGRTVVGVLEDAFQKFIGQPVFVFCSSRTDAGVHALSNVCHVDVERISKRKPDETLPPHEPSVVKKAVNHFLQKNEGDIMVIDVRCVPADFHSRYKAQERTYFYRLLSGKDPLSAFEKDRAWLVPEELNLIAMQAKSPIRTLDELTVSEMSSSPCFPSILEREQTNCSARDSLSCSDKPETNSSVTSGTSDQSKTEKCFGEVNTQEFGRRKGHRCLVVTARSRSFLYHQVRLLVGVLKSVGTGDLTVSDVRRILEAKNVAAASPMAPACGLYLGHVKYDLHSVI